MRFALFIGLMLTAAMPLAAESYMPAAYGPIRIAVESTGAAPQAVPPPAGMNWYVLANHMHTEYSSTSDSNTTVEERIAGAAADGADSAVISDHQTQGGCGDPGFAPVDGCVPVCCEEWGWKYEHMLLFNMTAGDPMKNWPVEDAISGALSRGATLIINHPAFELHRWRYDDIYAGISGIEIWNSFYVMSDSPLAVEMWQAYLAKGQMLFGIGGSDIHFGGNTLEPCNYVLATGNQPDQIQEGLDARRLCVAKDQDGYRCFIWCDADGDGQFEVPMGGNVRLSAQTALKFRVEAFDLPDATVALITSQGDAVTIPVGEGAPWYADVVATAGPGVKDFVRAELRLPDNPAFPVMSFTNPIFINYTPADADSDGVSDVLEEERATDKYDADTDGDNVSDKFEMAYDGDLNTFDPFDPIGNPGGLDLDPLNPDTDGDGVKDGVEIHFGSDPVDPARTVTMPLAGPGVLVLLMAAAGMRLRHKLLKTGRS